MSQEENDAYEADLVLLPPSTEEQAQDVGEVEGPRTSARSRTNPTKPRQSGGGLYSSVREPAEAGSPGLARRAADSTPRRVNA